ncbi:NAD(P)/FAD-dependent oxidoreductase [Ornithinimicrobium avium]|uniref:FAD/NAD(P)-binding domain-containing protein n=1 Tax=Ornithinimicrobium avium TaxID=2283195 RepID=A0A345NN78_9MICO|nr:FAD-dependent oxidoreductase [Ornithinimicrobium avium]AXH96486.1 hypothetical protein DV701_10435 [Ornithinimicrobium avium]
MTRVVMLGGGYVTLHAYAQLVRRLGARVRSGELEIVVISADDCHSFHGFTGEVVAGLLPLERTRTPLTGALPLASIVHGRATHVDPVARTVSFVRHGAGTTEQVGYAELVVGTGGREPLTTVPGLVEHGFTLRGVGEIGGLAEHLHDVLADLPREGAPEDPRRRVVVAGGGIAGTELAAAVADLGHGRLEVLLVHGGEELLPELRGSHPRLAHRVEHELSRLGVRVLLGTRLARVTGRGAVLTGPAGPAAASLHPAATVLATIGQVPVVVPGTEGLARDARGRLVTAADLSVVDAPGIWSAGDAARVLHPVTGEPVPTNALWAIKAGAHLGANLARRLRARPTRPFGYRGLGQAASYGLGRSVAELYGMELTGGAAWLLRLTFFLRFMPTRRGAAGVVRDLTAVLLTGTRPPAVPSPLSRAGAPAPATARAPVPVLLAAGPPDRAAQAGAR